MKILREKLGGFGVDVLWNVGSLGLLAASGILMNLIILRFRGEAALGVFNQVYAVYIVLSQVGVGGLQRSVLKHVSHSPEDRADITTSALVLVLLFTLPVALGAALLAGRVGALLGSSDVGHGLLLVAPGLLFFAWNKVLMNTVNGLGRMRAYAVLRSLRFVLIPLGILGVVALELPSGWLPVSFTLAEGALFGVLAGFVYARLVPLGRLRDARGWFRRHLSFGLRGVLSGVLLELNTRVDVLILGYFTTDALVGVYSFAAMLAEGAGQIPVALGWNVDPVIGRHFANGDADAVTQMAQRLRRGFYPLMAALSAAAVAVYPVFFALWAPESRVVESWAVFGIIMVGVALNAGYRPFTGVLVQGGRPGAYTLFILALVGNDALLNLVAIPLWGIYGAALVTAVTYVLEAVFLVWLARRLFGIRL